MTFLSYELISSFSNLTKQTLNDFNLGEKQSPIQCLMSVSFDSTNQPTINGRTEYYQNTYLKTIT